MVSYEIPIMETETYIHHFMQVIITYLEENDSDKALEMFLGDMRKEIGTYFAALESKLELVLNQISNLNKEKINSCVLIKSSCTATGFSVFSLSA